MGSVKTEDIIPYQFQGVPDWHTPHQGVQDWHAPILRDQDLHAHYQQKQYTKKPTFGMNLLKKLSSHGGFVSFKEVKYRL